MTIHRSLWTPDPFEHWESPPPNVALAPDEVHLWAIQLDLPAARQRALPALLAPDERARAARFHFTRDRHRWIAGRGQLREVLARYLRRAPTELAFRYECPCGKPDCGHAHRKPALDEATPLRFNLSHAGAFGLIAVSADRAVGVDLEYQRPTGELLSLAPTICSPDELAALQRLPEASQATALLALWTHKEAYLKARGVGLFVAPQEVVFGVDTAEPGPLRAVSGDAAEATRWSVAGIPLGPSHVAAFAVEGPAVQARRWRLT